MKAQPLLRHSILDFTAALLTRGLLDMAMIEQRDGDAKSVGGFDKLYTSEIEPLFPMLRDGAAETRTLSSSTIAARSFDSIEQESVRVQPMALDDDDHHMNAAGEITPVAAVSVNLPAATPQQDFVPLAEPSLTNQIEPVHVVCQAPDQPGCTEPHGDTRQ